MLKVMLYLERPAKISKQEKNYTIFSNFAAEGKMTIRVAGYQIMLQADDVEFIANALRLLAPRQLAKHMEQHKKMIRRPANVPLSELTNTSDPSSPSFRQLRVSAWSSSSSSSSLSSSSSTMSSTTTNNLTSPSSKKLTTRPKQSYSDRSNSPGVGEPSISRQQDDRLAPSPAPKPVKRNRQRSSPATSSSSTTSSITLSPDQQEAFFRFQRGDNLFVTGPGGTGKSVLITKCIEHCDGLRLKHAVTATTGVAACNVQGQTIHSWSGLSVQDVERATREYRSGASGGASGAPLANRHLSLGLLSVDIVRKLKRYNVENWKTTKVLVIDEISMLSDVSFDLLDIVGQLVRSSPLPFGGIQL